MSSRMNRGIRSQLHLPGMFGIVAHEERDFEYLEIVEEELKPRLEDAIDIARSGSSPGAAVRDAKHRCAYHLAGPSHSCGDS